MWKDLLIDSGLNEREVSSIMILGANPKMKASELAKELSTTRLDAYNSLSRLQEMGIVTVTADRPMLFSSLNVHQAIDHIISMRKEQLNHLLEGYENLSKEVDVKEEKNNGYNAVQLAYGKKSKNNTNKPAKGHLSKSGLDSVKVLAEFKSIEDFNYKLGQQFDASIFNVGEIFFCFNIFPLIIL